MSDEEIIEGGDEGDVVADADLNDSGGGADGTLRSIAACTENCGAPSAECESAALCSSRLCNVTQGSACNTLADCVTKSC